MSAVRDLTGQRFGRLTVLEQAGRKNGRVLWLCQCDCGNLKIEHSSYLTAGKVKSCGCLHKELLAEINSTTKTTHGKTHTRLYSIWRSMKKRCCVPTNDAYCRYGGRGITVCKEWMSFENFEKWAKSNGYKNGLTIDRKDNNAGYSLENCRWATRREQNLNKRNNHFVEYNGEVKTISEWAETLGTDRKKLRYRLATNNWDLLEVIKKGVV